MEFSDITLKNLENQEYLNTNAIPIENIKQELKNFTDWFNIVKLNRNNFNDDINFLLLKLQNSINNTIGGIQQDIHEFECCCRETIRIKSNENFWTILQQHEHFEQVYVDFLNGKFDNEENEVSTDEDDNDDDINNFRFNFSISYDETVQDKLYPESIVGAVRRIDGISEYTIQRSGRSRGICLLCPCELVNQRISKHTVLAHVSGQRHIRCAANASNVTALKKYHETFMNFEISYQAHQVYFRPDIGIMVRCMLCKKCLKYEQIQEHIDGSEHKKKVLVGLLRSQGKSVYFLTDLQIQIYGDEADEVISKITAIENERNDSVNGTNNEIDRAKLESDSSPSSEKKIAHNIIKSIENPNSKNIYDLLPNRFQSHVKFFKIQANMMRCIPCNIKFSLDVNLLKIHIQNLNHLQKSKEALIKYVYYCEVCNKRITEEKTWEEHITKGHDGPASEYECTICKTVIFGDEKSLTRHLSVYLRSDRNRKKETKLPEVVKKWFASPAKITNEAELFVVEATEVLLDSSKRTRRCCQEIERVLKSTFGTCKVHPFGSRISGLGNHESDLDLFVDTGNMYNGYLKQDPLNQIQIVRKAERVFHKCKQDFDSVFSIPTARTPIIKLYHLQTELDCDLSFRHGLSVENTKFLRFCLTIQPIAHPFILLLKKWSEMCKLNEHITTYALAIMAIFYLETKSYLLTIKRLRELNSNGDGIMKIDGWTTVNLPYPIEKIYTNEVKMYKTNGLKGLLMEFFKYYSNFKYSEDIVCPLLGYPIKRTVFTEKPFSELMKAEMNDYVQKLKNGDGEFFRILSPMCVQDPFDLSHNLTKACSVSTLNTFKTLCELTYLHLEHLK